jgi:DNA replication and repair protein RecF
MGGRLAIAYVQSRIVEQDYPDTKSWPSPSQGTRQVLSAGLASALAAARPEELKRGVTAVGPHRDDFVVTVDGIDIGRFGSRGQQRLAVVALKLAELDLLAEAGSEPPILLLDDVLSELDLTHRGKLVSTLATRKAQICVTATDIDDLASRELEHLPLWRSQSGTIELVERD